MSSYQYITQSGLPRVTKPGATYDCSITIKNTGADTWKRDVAPYFRMGTQNPQDGASGFYVGPTATTGWVSSSRIQLPQATVAPNQTVTITFKVKIPDYGGDFKQHFQFVTDGAGGQWLTGPDIYFRTIAPAKIGIFKFGWYGPGNYRWVSNNPVNVGYATDEPNYPGINPQYDSTDIDTINAQLQLVSEMGFDHVILDWWLDSDNYQHLQLAATRTIQQINALFPELKYSFLVEPPNGYTGSTGVPVPQATYDYFYTNYGSDPQFQTYDNKKLIYTFYPRYPGSGDSRFTSVALSNNRPGYVDYWAEPATITNNIMSLMHRFNNASVLAPSVAHPGPYNTSLDTDLFQRQFGIALQNRSSLKLVQYSSENEHYELQNGPEVSQRVRDELTAAIALWKANQV